MTQGPRVQVGYDDLCLMQSRWKRCPTDFDRLPRYPAARQKPLRDGVEKYYFSTPWAVED
jgi:hypothetical protein